MRYCLKFSTKCVVKPIFLRFHILGVCASDQFECDGDGDGGPVCIPRYEYVSKGTDVRCNGEYDCADWLDNPNDKSDEENCGCYSSQVDPDEDMPLFECKLSQYCLRMPLRCDGKVDCDKHWHGIYNGTDKSDEENCQCFKDSDCNEPYPQCLFGKCRVSDEDQQLRFSNGFLDQPSYGKVTPSTKGK